MAGDIVQEELEPDDVILEMQNIVKIFPGVRAVNDVSFKLRRGTVHALVGENGAGKSTLMKILSGIHTPNSGRILYKGTPVIINSPQKAIEMGISMIYQELNSVLNMTVAENLFLGREILKKSRLLDWKQMNSKAKSVLKDFQLDCLPTTKLKTMSVANRQILEIAKAINSDAEIIVMDEPTSSISGVEVETLFEIIKTLKQKGISIIYISHRLEELPFVADEITIIRDGEKIKNAPMSEMPKDEIIRLMVGRELTNLFPKTVVPLGEEILRIEGFGDGRKFHDISFNLRRGEILGISGLIGSGRTEMARAIFGLDRAENGECMIEGKPIKVKNATGAIRAGLAMLTEDRKRYGVVLCRSIKENITLPHLKKYSNRFSLLKRKKETTDIATQMKLLNIKANSMNALTNSLSGGNQQKVVVAKWMVDKPKVLIMDEPTRGIDVGSKYEIYKLMCQLAAEGLGIIMISSELPEILGMSDRIIVMADGRIKGELTQEDATQVKIMSMSAGSN